MRGSFIISGQLFICADCKYGIRRNPVKRLPDIDYQMDKCLYMLHQHEGIKRTVLKDPALSYKAPEALGDTLPKNIILLIPTGQNKTKQKLSFLAGQKHRAVMTTMCTINPPAGVSVHHMYCLATNMSAPRIDLYNLNWPTGFMSVPFQSARWTAWDDMPLRLQELR